MLILDGSRHKNRNGGHECHRAMRSGYGKGGVCARPGMVAEYTVNGGGGGKSKRSALVADSLAAKEHRLLLLLLLPSTATDRDDPGR